MFEDAYSEAMHRRRLAGGDTQLPKLNAVGPIQMARSKSPKLQHTPQFQRQSRRAANVRELKLHAGEAQAFIRARRASLMTVRVRN